MQNWRDHMFWYNSLGWNVNDLKIEPLHNGNSGSSVFRVHLSGQNLPNSVIVKETFEKYGMAQLKHEAGSYQRESLFYSLANKLQYEEIATVHYNSLSEVNRSSLIILEDLSSNYYLPNENYVWSENEKDAILSYYISLYKFTQKINNSGLQTTFLAKPESSYVTPVDIVESMYILDTWEPTKMMVAYIKDDIDLIINKLNIIHQEFNKLNKCLCYNDFYPGNVAVSKNMNRVILFDFQLIGWGTALNNMVNAFGNKSFSYKSNNYQKKYLESINFRNKTSFNLMQLYKVNDLLSSLFIIYLTARKAVYYPDNKKLPSWVNNVIKDLPFQCRDVNLFI